MPKISHKEWLDTYQPLTEEDDVTIREFEQGELTLFPTRNIWTEMDNGAILSGFRFVNRVRHIVTIIPWLGDDLIEVVND